MSGEPNRRRHERERVAADVVVSLYANGAAVPIARVIDASLGGALLEIARDTAPPALSSTCRCMVSRGATSIERGARVVRIRWGGRERGEPVLPAVALVFDDADADAAQKLDTLLR